MRLMLTIAATAMLCAIAAAQPKTDWKELQLKGKVKSVTAKQTYRYKKNGVFTNWERTYGRTTRFNSTGSRTEFSEFLGNDSLSYRITYSYKPQEKKIELSYFNKELKPTSKTIYQLNEKGYKTEELQYAPNGTLNNRYLYSFDNSGNMTTMTGYKPDGTLTSKTTWKFDARNYRTEYLVETPGYANSSKKFVHDDKGNLTEETWYDGKGAITFRFVREYDTNGNIIKEIKYKGSSDKPVDTVTWRYDYDKAGNWTKKTETTSDGTDFHIEERTILYY